LNRLLPQPSIRFPVQQNASISLFPETKASSREELARRQFLERKIYKPVLRASLQNSLASTSEKGLLKSAETKNVPIITESRNEGAISIIGLNQCDLKKVASREPS
jgi:hypothetical protein